MTVLIRPAVTHDAAPLSMLARETFIDTYAAFNTAQDMNLHLAASYGPGQQDLEIKDVNMLTIVAEAGARLVGFAQGRFNALPPGCDPQATAQHAAWEILRFYVHCDWHGRGLAARLMDRATSHARNIGADGIWLSVWHQNPRAQAFYRKCGFRQIGETTFTLGQDVQRDFVMFTSI